MVDGVIGGQRDSGDSDWADAISIVDHALRGDAAGARQVLSQTNDVALTACALADLLALLMPSTPVDAMRSALRTARNYPTL